jgi:hypothetical protein
MNTEMDTDVATEACKERCIVCTPDVLRGARSWLLVSIHGAMVADLHTVDKSSRSGGAFRLSASSLVQISGRPVEFVQTRQ